MYGSGVGVHVYVVVCVCVMPLVTAPVNDVTVCCCLLTEQVLVECGPTRSCDSARGDGPCSQGVQSRWVGQSARRWGSQLGGGAHVKDLIVKLMYDMSWCGVMV